MEKDCVFTDRDLQELRDIAEQFFEKTVHLTEEAVACFTYFYKNSFIDSKNALKKKTWSSFTVAF